MMMKTLNLVLMACAIAVPLLFALWLVTFKFSECKKVGHSTLYCLLDMR